MNETTSLIGTKIYIENFDANLYRQCANWCNESQIATIVKKENYYECVALERHIPTEEEIQIQMTEFVQNYMDTTARERGYDNIHTAVSYANSGDAIFRAEGQACLDWRDKVWRTCYNILDEVKAGNIPIPTTDELILMLPALEW